MEDHQPPSLHERAHRLGAWVGRGAKLSNDSISSSLILFVAFFTNSHAVSAYPSSVSNLKPIFGETYNVKRVSIMQFSVHLKYHRASNKCSHRLGGQRLRCVMQLVGYRPAERLDLLIAVEPVGGGSFTKDSPIAMPSIPVKL